MFSHFFSSLAAATLFALAATLALAQQDFISAPEEDFDLSALSFDCTERTYGYYADVETDCRVFHICLGEGDLKWSFFCPNLTRFNQQYMTCDWYFNVECDLSDQFFHLNNNFGVVPAPNDEEQHDQDHSEDREDQDPRGRRYAIDLKKGTTAALVS